MSAAERMERLRNRRKSLGLKEIRFWVKEENLDKAKKITSVFERIALYSESEGKLRALEAELEEKLKEFKTWESYLKTKYDFSLEPSTEKQRKYALRIASVSQEKIPVSILGHKGLLSTWIQQALKESL